MIRLLSGFAALVVLASLTMVTPAAATEPDDTTTIVEPADPAADAVDAYVDATGGGTEGSTGSWLFVAAFGVAMVGTFVIAVKLRRRGTDPAA